MPFQIRHDGKTYTVHTVVGDGPTRVEFTEDQPQQAEPQSLDSSGDAS